MFRVKICGISSVDDARDAVAAGADAIGLNFYPASPRHCPLDRAIAIARQLPSSVCKVGVFVNTPPAEIRDVAQAVGLDLAQLHGEEPPELLREIRPLAAMRAMRIGKDLAGVADYLQACYRLNAMPRMVLLDASMPGQYGGTGATIDWAVVRANRPHLGGVPLVLAGGLTPDNVAEAIAATRPWAVDTASGVEESPGKKSADKVRRFVAAAKAALAAIATGK